MPYTKPYIHLVWATKHRTPFLQSLDLRNKVWNHIYENAAKKEIHVHAISGYSDHCHCLISLKPDQTIKKVIQLIKGESSYWINHQDLLHETPYTHFKWQHEYCAVSVSPKALRSVKKYINNQEKHHRIQSFHEEYNEYLNRNGFQLMG